MADQDYEIATKLTWESDNAALNEASNQLEALAVKAAGLAAAYMGVREAWNFVHESFQDAVVDEKLFTQLTENAELFGNATHAVAEGLEGWILNMEKTSGMSKQELIPAMTQAMSKTNDVAKAQQFMEIAAGAAARGVGSLQANITALARSMETGKVRGFGPFQNLLRESIKDAGSFAGAVEKLGQKFGDAGEDVNTTAMQLERAQIAFKETKAAIGGLVLGEGSSLEGGALKVLSIGLAVVAAGLWKVIGYGEAFAKSMWGWGTVIDDVLSGHLLKARDDFNTFEYDVHKIMKDHGDAATNMLTKVFGAFDSVTAHATAHMTKAQADQAKLSEALARDADAAVERMDKEDEAAKAFEKTENERIALLNKGATEQIRLAKQVEEAELKYMNEVEAAAQKLNKEDEARESKENAAYEARVKVADKVGKELANKHKKWNSEELKALIEMLKKEEEAELASGMVGSGIHKDLIDANQELDVISAQEKQKMDQDAVASTISSAGEIFGVQKAASLAIAIMHAFEAASGASAQTQGDVYTRIAAYVATFAEVWNAVEGIEGTSMGGGSGSGGGGGAATSISIAKPNVYTGYGSAPSSGSNTQVTTNKPTYNNVTINALDTNNALRTLQTNLRPASRNYDRSIGTRTPTSIGSKRGG